MRQAPSKEHSNCSKKSMETAPIQRRPAPPSPLFLSPAQAAHHHHQLSPPPLPPRYHHAPDHSDSPIYSRLQSSRPSGVGRVVHYLRPKADLSSSCLAAHQWSARSISPYPYPNRATAFVTAQDSTGRVVTNRAPCADLSSSCQDNPLEPPPPPPPPQPLLPPPPLLPPSTATPLLPRTTRERAG